MEKRYVIFMLLALAILTTNALVSALLQRNREQQQMAERAKEPKKPIKPDAKAVKKPGDKQPEKPADKLNAEKPDAEKPKAEHPEPGNNKEPERPDAQVTDKKPLEVPRQWLTLGSADMADPYRMLVTLTNQGAAVERIELNSDRYRDLEDRSGYLGHLELADAPKLGGALVRVVGVGTPAAKAGLKGPEFGRDTDGNVVEKTPGDVIERIDEQRVRTAAELVSALQATAPDQTVSLTVASGGKTRTVSATLGRRPLEVVRPELNTKPLDIVQGPHDPFSLLLTLQQIDDRKLGDDESEFKDVNLREGTWDVVPGGKADTVSFQKDLPKLKLRATKTYRLERVEGDSADAPSYHLLFMLEIKNMGKESPEVAYRLEGPTGLPLEGSWYANKVTAGLRDVVSNFGRKVVTEGCAAIADGGVEGHAEETGRILSFIAVDAQYFAAALLPQRQGDEVWFSDVRAARAGEVPSDKNDKKLTNVTFRMSSDPVKLAPGASIKHEYQFFAGPKKPALLAEYGTQGATLKDINNYGWFFFVAEPMLWILHFFYGIVHNYGVAIIMLTVLVRGCMFPLSRKQAMSAQKMQELKPEIDRINEKFKKVPQEKQRAQQELFRKHSYNPLGGCLLALVQLPIFVGLYRSLMVDVELRQAPLLSDSIRWCSNLAGPDMLLRWDSWMPEFFSGHNGWLGPYLNILPLVTIGLFIWQQKMFMPPPADENAAMQQKMMQWMMILMGVLFYKVASGLCIYFIASSLWGIGERKLLPKSAPPGAASPPRTVASVLGNGSGGSSKKKQSGKR